MEHRSESWGLSESERNRVAGDLEKVERGQCSEPLNERLAGGLTEEEQKQTIRKVDRRLLVILGVLYSISVIDRTNLGVARVAGLARDLGLTVGNRWSIITLVFFIPYIIFEFPSNILLRKVGARNLLSTLTLLWGGVMLSMGFVTTWQQLAGLRVLLGLLEAGFFPGCVFLISTWYTRYETQRRMAMFTLLAIVTAGFSNIISYGISKADGAADLAGWSWIFIIYGIITCVAGITAYFLIVDFPDKNTFLTPQQTQFIIERLNADRGDATPDKLAWLKTVKHFMDWKTWSFGFCFMAASTASYAFAYFLPVILSGAGYSTALSFCLSAPPWLAGAAWTFTVAFLSDKTRQRGAFVSLNALIDIVGLMIVGYAENRGVRYFGAFLAMMGAQANVPAILTYSANNTVSHSKRAVSLAIIIGMGGVGGILASTIYRQQDYPKYLPGLWATFACQMLILAAVAVNTIYFKTQNRKLDEGRRGPIEATPGFRYTL